MIWISDHRNTDDSVAAELAAYNGAIEERCEHLEEVVNSTRDLLRVIIKDFESPTLNPILGSLIERLNSIAVFLETVSDR